MHTVISAETGVFITFVVANHTQPEMQNGKKASQLRLRFGGNWKMMCKKKKNYKGNIVLSF